MDLRFPLSRRRALLSLGTVGLPWVTASAAVGRKGSQDAELVELGRQLDALMVARRGATEDYDAREARFFALRPPVPEALRADGPLGSPPSPGLRRWTAAELGHLAANTEEEEVSGFACRLLPVAEAFEAAVERLQRSTGLDEAEAAQGAESDALYEIAERIAELPASGGAGLMVKARALRQLEPDWWEGEGPETGASQRLAAQLADAVLAMGPWSRG